MRRLKKILSHPLMLLLYTALLMHGQIFLNNGVYWDGSLWYQYYLANNVHLLKHVEWSLGVPYFYYTDRLYWFLGYKEGIDIGAWLMIFSSGFFTYKILKLYRDIPLVITVIISVIVIAFPGSLLTFYRAVAQYYISYGFFFFAAYLGLLSEVLAGKTAIFFRCLSLIIFFFVCFTLHSLLMFYGVFFMALYILYAEQKEKKIFCLKSIGIFCLSHLDFFALPFLFQAISVVFYTPSGFAQGYNAIHIKSVGVMTHNFFHALHDTVYEPLKSALNFALLAILYMVIFKRNRVSKKYVFLFVFGVIALFFGLFPYILVSKIPDGSSFFSSRNALLMPLGIALMAGGICGQFFLSQDGKLRSAGGIVILVFLFSCFTFWNNWYIREQSASAMQKSLIYQLKQHPKWGKKYSVFWFKLGFPRNNQPIYADYAWAALLNMAYGGQRHYGWSDQPSNPSYYEHTLKSWFTSKDRNAYLYVTHFNVNGCQANLYIEPNKYNTGHRLIALNYLYYRFFKPKLLKEFYQNVMKIHLVPYHSWAAKDCHD